MKNNNICDRRRERGQFYGFGQRIALWGSTAYREFSLFSRLRGTIVLALLRWNKVLISFLGHFFLSFLSPFCTALMGTDDEFS